MLSPGAMRDRARQRWPIADVVFAVIDRFGAVGGGALAAHVGLSGFLSLFPLLLCGIAVVGFVSSGDPEFANEVIEQFGLEGDAARTVLDALESAEEARAAATIIGFAGLLWTGLGVVGSLSAAINAAWQSHGHGLLDKVRGLAWLTGAGVLFLLSVGATSLTPELPLVGRPLGLLVAAAITAVLFCWTFVTLSGAPVGWRVHVPGAVLAAVGSSILQVLGTIWLPRMVANSSALYGTVGIVFALLVWFLLYGRVFTYAAVLNVVLYERRFGTVRVEVEAPRIAGHVPLEADRGGTVVERTG
jgi:membrane protein